MSGKKSLVSVCLGKNYLQMRMDFGEKAVICVLLLSI